MIPIALALTAAVLDPAALSRGPAFPASIIGKVSGGVGLAHATGFLVGECEVLTVKHAAGWVKDPARFKFTFRQAGHGGQSSRARVVAQGALELVDDWWANDRSGDWMLLRLDLCLGAQVGFAELSDVPFEQTTYFKLGAPPLMSTGFHGALGQKGTMTLNPACRIRVITPRGHLNDCRATPGASGSPVFATVSAGRANSLLVFGMQVAANPVGLNVPGGPFVDSISIAANKLLPAIAPFLTKRNSRKLGPRQRIAPR